MTTNKLTETLREFEAQASEIGFDLTRLAGVAAPQIQAMQAGWRENLLALVDAYGEACWQNGLGEDRSCDWSVKVRSNRAAIESMLAATPAATPPAGAGMVLVPDYRGYAHLGTGQYLLNHSDAGEPPEVIISIATEEEKAGRSIGEERDNPPGHSIQPEAMAVRLRFANPAGLAVLENEIRKMRETHGWAAPSPAPAPAATTQQGQDERAAGDSACRWAVWWNHKRATFTTPRQAALAAWDEATSSRPRLVGEIPDGFSVVKLSQCAYRTKRGAIYGGTTFDAGTTPLFQILEIHDASPAAISAQAEPQAAAELLRELQECGAINNWLRVSDDLKRRIEVALQPATAPAQPAATAKPEHIPTPDDINAQDWEGMDGATAYQLIERHGEDWSHIGRLMGAWLAANTVRAAMQQKGGAV